MNEPLAVVLAFAAGLLLGAIFFGGLWWTIRRGFASPRPVSWFVGSLLLRSAFALGGFALVARGDWRRLLACLLGFFLARLAATRLSRAPRMAPHRALAGGRP
jgi:F1F0 ATPase subunit 2